MAKAKATAAKAPVVKEVARSPRPTQKPTAPSAAKPVTTPRPAAPAKPAPAQSQPQTPPDQPDRRHVWGLVGAGLVVVGLLGAWWAGTQGGLSGVQAAPLATVGDILEADAFWVRMAGLHLALGGIGIGFLGAVHAGVAPRGSAARVLAWSAAALATTWIVAGMFMALSADLASSWNHGAGAKAAFAAANIISGPPAGALLATVAVSAGMVWREGHKLAALLAWPLAFVAAGLAIAAMSEILLGGLAIATLGWAIIATLPLFGAAEPA